MSPGFSVPLHNLPPIDTDATAFLAIVVPAMRAKGAYFSCQQLNNWLVTFQIKRKRITEGAQTLPEAGCRAALAWAEATAPSVGACPGLPPASN